MIIAHIKSPFGDRTEEWEDNKINEQGKKVLEDYHAYVLGYPDDADSQKEQFGTVEKYYWDLYEEIQRFQVLQGNYAGLVAFSRRLLREVGSNFSRYIALEDPLAKGTNIEAERFAEIEESLSAIDMANRKTGEESESVLDGLEGTEFTAGSPEATLYDLLKNLHEFSFLLNDTIVCFGDILEGLETRARGEAYSPLEFVHDLEELKEARSKRQEQEKALTLSRNNFVKVFGNG